MTIEPVSKQIKVRVPPEQAFQVFTNQIGSWWPHDTHSIGLDRTKTVILEPHVGGRLYEIFDDGTEHDWGSVLEWEPPHRVTVSWHVSRGPEVFTEVEVQFVAVEGGTEVRLEHRHWERLGAEGVDLRAQYNDGWNPVLDRYVTAAGV